jgi:hypothetical protein
LVEGVLVVLTCSLKESTESGADFGEFFGIGEIGISERPFYII